MDGQLRRLIEAREQGGGLLEEYRAAAISEAVTGRIDVRTGQPYPAYKPSEIEWLGDIPAHWVATSIKRHFDIQLGKMLQNKPKSQYDVEVPYLKAKHVQWFDVSDINVSTMWASPKDLVQYAVVIGDLLVCEGGEGGRCGIVEEGRARDDLIIQNALHRVRPLSTSLNEFLAYLMRAASSKGWFKAINSKATIAHLTKEKLGSLLIPLPPLAEQIAIAEYLDRLTSKIDTAIVNTRRELELLEEYRTRMISDVVTGQVDVREAAALIEAKQGAEQ